MQITMLTHIMQLNMLAAHGEGSNTDTQTHMGRFDVDTTSMNTPSQ